MKRTISYAAAAAVLALLIFGFAVLATWEIPSPLTRTEKVIPDGRLPN
ncbi:MAG: hypothetical protein ACREGL_03335 [Alphaproteobacteria bacterium]